MSWYEPEEEMWDLDCEWDCDDECVTTPASDARGEAVLVSATGDRPTAIGRLFEEPGEASLPGPVASGSSGASGALLGVESETATLERRTRILRHNCH
jgi:hypothetical protein